jgi:hypothetical protein
MREQSPNEILNNMRSLKRWIQISMQDISCVLKIKKDVEYYNHQTAQLMVRVERLERLLAVKD